MAPTTKTNFKTYEASTRLLAAVIATNKGIKLDFKELAKYVGGGTTKDSVNHRLRPIKQLAKMQAACVGKGEDPGELPVEKGALADLVGGGASPSSLEHRFRPIKKLGEELTGGKEKEIQKLFGESTPGGIEWQFREIKHLGKAQQAAIAKKQNPAGVAVKSGSAASTPVSRASKHAAPGSASVGRTPSSRPPKRKAPRDDEDSDTDVKAFDVDDLSDDDDEDDDDDDDMDVTPSKPPPPKKSRVAHSATSTPAKVAAPKQTAEELYLQPSPATSLFGNGRARVQKPIETANPFEAEDELQEVIDLSQTQTRSPPKPVKQEKTVAAVAAAEEFDVADNDPFGDTNALLYGYGGVGFDDGEF
ncbi:Uu.00g091860.m01.CDS01 [Anthostomella pinea]|uniref:Uu.00g091860.m01.CDS01 n=1 Tax=Anthostomella pinea TaxID=933095 RepID=A0AAI8VN60_9PEZI|nr:Uu.00g091860.m01.CDS01 [Anthostomella pinea]